jgi:hypothetical protein
VSAGRFSDLGLRLQARSSLSYGMPVGGITQIAAELNLEWLKLQDLTPET